MKYDIIIGNPPYNEGGNGVNKAIYTKFVLKSLDYLKPDGKLVMVTPGGWMDSNKKSYGEFRKTLKLGGLKTINTTNVFDHLTISQPVWFIIDKSYKGDIIFNGNIITNTYDTSEIKIKTQLDQIYNKLLNNTLPVIRGGVYVYQTHKNKYKDTIQGDYQHKFICNNDKNGPKIVYVKSEHFKPYVNSGGLVIFNERWDKNKQQLSNVSYIPNGNEYSFNCNILAIPVKDQVEANTVIKYINSNIFRFMLGAVKSSGQALIVGKLRKLPHWNTKFNLSKDELKIINEQFK